MPAGCSPCVHSANPERAEIPERSGNRVSELLSAVVVVTFAPAPLAKSVHAKSCRPLRAIALLWCLVLIEGEVYTGVDATA